MPSHTVRVLTVSHVWIFTVCTRRENAVQVVNWKSELMNAVQVVNWKSELMNFTLDLIYPAPDDEGRKNIPSSELVCVIDADQARLAAPCCAVLLRGDPVRVPVAVLCYHPGRLLQR
jgi:hypothetical protein